MREIDVIAQEKFNGDSKQAIEYLLYTVGENGFGPYIDELTQDEARFVVSILNRDAIKYFGSEKRYKEELIKNQSLAEFNLTEEEVRNTPKNPYKATLLKHICTMLLMNGGIIALSSMGIDISALGLVQSVVTGLLAMTMAGNIIEYVKFKKMKKLVDKHYEEGLSQTESRGRSM